MTAVYKKAAMSSLHLQTYKHKCNDHEKDEDQRA